MAFQLNLRSSRQTFRDENLEAKVPGGGGRVKGGTEATTRSILDTTAAAIQSNRVSSRYVCTQSDCSEKMISVECPGIKPNLSTGESVNTPSGSYPNRRKASARSSQAKNGYSSLMPSAIGCTATTPALCVKCWPLFDAWSDEGLPM